jgi:alpha-N-arabinofuranosidase
MRPEFYADLYRQYATFIKAPRDNKPQRIASGANASNTAWTEVLMREAGKHMDALTVHYYTLPRGAWKDKGASTGFPETEWISTFTRTLRMDEILANHSKIMDQYDPERRVGLLVDEWGTWYDVEPGTNEGFLYQQNSLRDALVAAVNLNIFHRHAARVRMTNIAQMVNVLQAMILTDGPKMLKTPTYHAFAMYKPFRGAQVVPVEVTTPEYRLDKDGVPAVHATAARDKSGALHIAIANLDPRRPATVELRLTGQNLKELQGQILTAATMDAINTFDQPDSVRPATFKAPRARGEQVQLELPAKSLLVLSQR